MNDAARQKDAAGMDATPEIIIPNDLAGCRALIEQLASTVTLQTSTIDVLRREKQELEAAYAELVQRAFRHRSERYIENPNQLMLDLGGTADAADAAEGLGQAVEEAGLPVKAHTRRRHASKPRSEALPEHLPRYEVEARVPERTKHCPQHGQRTLIGYDRVEKLEFERPKLRVRVTRYPKYACSGHADCGIASPERPTGLVEGDRYDTSVAAEIITAKYGFHLPVYRQQDLFAGSGWTPDRSTLLNLLVASASFFRPLAEYLKRVVLTDDALGTDETRVTLLVPPAIPEVDANDPKSRRTHEVLSEAAAAGRRSVTARMWAYRGINIRLNVFDFTVSRHRDGPDLMLAEYAGTLLADCYSGFQGIALGSDGRIRRAACNAHARRKIFDARENYPLESSVVLAKFQQLYDIEDRARAASAEERLALRQSEAVPVWRSLGEWLESKPATDVLPKSKLGEALGYLRNHWEPLQTYLNDGRVPIDNNEVEQLMKQVAIGRKNWLFIGSVAAGDRAADFLTLVSSAVRNDLDVWAYLKDVLDRLLAGDTDYAALRPDVWRQAHPEAIREYRVAERRDRADRKQLRRSERRRLRSASPR
ncbi:MAG: IS66 family transposase [Gemmatimonadota bacterium]